MFNIYAKDICLVYIISMQVVFICVYVLLLNIYEYFVCLLHMYNRVCYSMFNLYVY